MRYSAVMTTVDRCPGPNYVEATIDDLVRSGFFDFPDVSLTLIESGSGDLTYLDFLQQRGLPVMVEYSPERLPLNLNHARALAFGAQRADEYVLFMEDDIVVRENLMPAIDRFVARHQEKSRVWSFFFARRDIVGPYYRGDDHILVPGKDFFGTLCMALRRQDAQSLADFYRHEVYGRRGLQTGADSWIGEWLEAGAGPGKVCCSVPSYVQHRGVRSSIDDRGYLVAPCFERQPSSRLDLHKILDRSPVRAPDLELRGEGQNFLIIRSGTAQAFHCNHITALVWQLCDGSRTVAALRRELHQAFPGREDQIDFDLSAVLASLLAGDLIELKN